MAADPADGADQKLTTKSPFALSLSKGFSFL